ncbi:MAG: hypothetical protein QGG88_09150 [Gammaproteobacteria bacterium]|nr:hypothetical protein [Gammaproteobacteria bacterium]
MNKHGPLRIIYITGRGGDANKGLGAYLKKLDASRIGLSVNSSFLQLPFSQQVRFVAELIDEFDAANTYIIANSYGAYLCLHALLGAPEWHSRMLLLAPAIGSAVDTDAMFYARLPSAKIFSYALEQSLLTKPAYIAVHIGEADLGFNEALFHQLQMSLDLDMLNIIPNQGHNLNKATVQNIVKDFLTNEA